MAALLRDGARRVVGGSVFQRTRAPAAAQERRLLSTQDLTPRPAFEFFDRVQQTKEELYDKLSLMEGTRALNYQNRQLLQVLSGHVKPRPDDSLWRRMRALQRMKVAFRATVAVTGCALAFDVCYSVKQKAKQNAKKREQ